MRTAFNSFARNVSVVSFAVAIVFDGPHALQADAPEFPIVTGVKTYVTSPKSREGDFDEEQPVMGMAPSPTVPTLPAAKWPQYSIGLRDNEVRMREIIQTGVVIGELTITEQIVRVRFEIEVDGKPFPVRRRSQIAEALRSAQNKDVTEEPQNEKPTADKKQTQELNDEDTEVTEPDDAPEAAPSVETYRATTDAAEMIRRYVVAVGHQVDLEEANWLVSQWNLGPDLVMLKPSFQQLRGNERPVFAVLDSDHDAVLSAEEIEQAAERLSQCDTDRNDIVEMIELDEAAKDSRLDEQDHEVPGGRDLLKLSDDRTTACDLQFKVAINSDDPNKSEFRLVDINELAGFEAIVSGHQSGTITLLTDSKPIEFSVVQSSADGSLFLEPISIGAVVEGYPLLWIADPNSDGRITIRERRGLKSGLSRADSDGDGQLTTAETPPTIRVCIGIGPIVHRELATLRRPAGITDETPTKGPDWFVRMDRNADGDVSRNEFPGDDEQFSELDGDHDELISGAEAITFDNISNPTADDE